MISKPSCIKLLDAKSMNKFRKDSFWPCRFRFLYFPFFLYFFSPFVTFGQTLIQEISLKDRIQRSSLITEGRVMDQESFWKNDSSGIYTRHVIEVYKDWKDLGTTQQIVLVTPGGRVGQHMEVVTPSLSLSVGDVGIFFLEQLQNSSLFTLAGDRSPLYQPYSSLQGFIGYDESVGKARDLHHIYPNLKADLYPRINELVGSTFQNIQRYDLNRPQISSRDVPIVSELSPQTISAGTGSELSIRGSSFGDQGNVSAVFFPNADNGGASYISSSSSQIVSWTDTQIVVIVPSNAGSGTVRVKNNDNQLGESSYALNISYSQINISAGGKIFRPFLADRNQEGGYTLQYSTSDEENGVDFTSIGQEPFERALEQWHCATGVQFQLGPTTTSTELNASNSPNLILFSNDVNTLPDGVLGRTNSWFISCDGKSWLLDGFDMIFRKSGTGGITWNFSEDDPCFGCYDFESVALHELGHAHLLGHVINTPNVMHYAIHNGTSKRNLEPNSAIMGANLILGEKAGEGLCFSFYPGMAPDFPSCGAQVATLRAKVYLEGFFEAETGTMHEHLSNKGLLPLEPRFLDVFGYTGRDQVTTFPARTTDWMLVQLLDSQDSSLVAQKAVLLRSDGVLMELDGNEYLSFEETEEGDYFLSLHHTGHLSIISSRTVYLGPEGELYDFTQEAYSAQGENPQSHSSGVYQMYAGDYTADGLINDEDFHAWRLERVLINGYSPSDGNGDGQISVQDANLWRRNRAKASAAILRER